MTAQLRAAHAADLPSLLAIYNAAILETTATREVASLSLEERQTWWDAHQDPRYPIIVAEQEGRIIGYACLSQWLSGPVYARTAESSVFLAPDSQGRGLGTRLMAALLEEARRLEHHVVIARVWSQNAASLALCRKCGYEIVGVQKEVGWRQGRWEDCVILQVTL